MQITEVRIFPTKSKEGRLKAYATMTFDDWFVIRNVKIIQGNNGVFVAMPSRKVMDSCVKCGFKNGRGSKFCNDCGSGIKKVEPQESREGEKRENDHMDIAHPIKQDCRVYIQDKILEAYNKEADNAEADKIEADNTESDKTEEVAAEEKQPETSDSKAGFGISEEVADNIGNIADGPISDIKPEDTEGQDIAL